MRATKGIYRPGDIARHWVTGARVRILEALPNGLEIFYKVEHVLTGATFIVRNWDLRDDRGEAAS